MDYKTSTKSLIKPLLFGGGVCFIFFIFWVIDPSSSPLPKSWTAPVSSRLPWTSRPLNPADYKPTGFDILSNYDCKNISNSITSVPSFTSRKDFIPSAIKSLNGKNIAVQGYIVPLVVKDGAITSFMLCKNTNLCCYGIPLQMNEWVEIEMKNGKIARLRPDIPMIAYGTIEVGEKYDATTSLINLYRMKADDVLAVKDQF